MSNMRDYDYLFNFIIVGDSGVGKSSLLLRFADDAFLESHIATIGCDFKIRTVDIDGEKCKLHMWDTAGQERFKTITTNYYRGAHGIILVYDVTNPDSFENLKTWFDEVDKYGKPGAVKLIVGNKSDLREKRVISYETAKNYAEKLDVPMLETSARNSINVERTFMTLTAEIKNTVSKGTLDDSKEEKIQVKIKKSIPVQENKCFCSL